MGAQSLHQRGFTNFVVPNLKETVPKGGGRAASGGGTNSSGNSYTSYSKSGGGQPTGYSYSNANGSSYYNDGAGHGFYHSPPDGTKSSGGQAYSTHYNYNAGTSSSKTK